MTKLNNGTIVTDMDAVHGNTALTEAGYTIRAIETWHDRDATCILWDAPDLSEADCPF